MPVLAALFAFSWVAACVSVRRGVFKAGRDRRVPRGESFLVDQSTTLSDFPNCAMRFEYIAKAASTHALTAGVILASI